MRLLEARGAGDAGGIVSADGRSGQRPLATTLLALTAALFVAYAGACKALLFHDLEYFGSDLFSFLEMSRSWFHSGRLLWDNVYGDNTAIHNFYLLLAFSPLTIPLGAYGLIAGLVLLNLVAVLRVAYCPALDLPGRVATIAGLLSPTAFFVFDHPVWGFHPELCYPPLALLLACDLLDGRRRRAIVPALLMLLVKEDGAVLCAGVLVAFSAQRFWALPRESREQRRKIAREAFLGVLAMILIFAIGMAALYVRSRALAQGGATAPVRLLDPTRGDPGLAGSGSLEGTASTRLMDSLKVVVLTLSGRGDHQWRVRLTNGFVGYFLMSTLVLLPLGRRFFRAVNLLALASPPLLVVLAISSAPYGFGMLVWPPRVGTLLALVVACLAFAASTSASAGSRARRRAFAVGVGALIALSWGLQLPLLGRLGYSPWPRLQALAQLSGRGYRASTFRPHELRFLRCLSDHLPWGLPVTSFANTHPVFHLQSVVFQGIEGRAWRPPRVRVISSPGVVPAGEGAQCRDPGVGGFAVEADCALLPVVSRCSRQAKGEPPS